MPLRTREQDHSPTHHPTVIPSTTTYVLNLTLGHDEQVEPLLTFSATFWDLLPFLCACGLALIFTSLLVLLVEDSSNDSTVLGVQQSQVTSYQRRNVGLSEKERGWPMGSQSSYYGDSPVLRNATGSPSEVTVTAQPSNHQRPVFPKGLVWYTSIALSPYSSSHICAPRPSISLILDLIALLPSSTSPSPTQA